MIRLHDPAGGMGLTTGNVVPAPLLVALGLPGDTPALPVSGGADMTIWRLIHDAPYALRLFRADHAAAFQRETAAMRAASAGGLPVPVIQGETHWHGRPALLLDWMPGQPLRRALCSRPTRSWISGVAFGRAQARVHQTPPPTMLLERPTDWIELADPDDALRHHLLATVSGPPALLHLDFHPLNVLVVDRQVSAILDWTNARAGDPRADLARTAAILRFTPVWDCLPAPVAGVVRRLFVAGWRHGYRELAGPAHGMAPFYAWAGAAMVRDLRPRLGRADLPWITEALLADIETWSAGWLTHTA